MSRFRSALALLAGASLAGSPAGVASAPADPANAHHFSRERRLPPSLEPILSHLAPGTDAFPEEKTADELARRLGELSALLRETPSRPSQAADRLLAPEFHGSRLSAPHAASVGVSPALEVFRAPDLPATLVRDRTSFAEELQALVADFQAIDTAELLITHIEVKASPQPEARTEVRYDLVGTGRPTGRVERLGYWRMEWRRGADGVWRILTWTSRRDTESRAASPVFTETTTEALGANPSFRRQLVPGLDHWSSVIDGVFAPGGMGHHGVSVGDVDGDGLDDLYVSQPAGLPNRLFRNRGDGSFEDVTEAAAVGVLDRTSQSLFADVDNDGDQDLVLVIGSGLRLLLNDGKGHFADVPDAFRFQGSLTGSPTSVAMADYDRDGFLDLYVCTYAYVIGASEDKAGPATPYHDARNGPPNVLLRNDGHGHFVDVTAETGLDENNDRFSFAAAWGDYDEDGWPDLLVSNDFGRKNLYHNEGMKAGKVRFKDVAAAAGLEDYGAGMSACWLDYDNDGHLDVYTGNMWTAAGQRVTALPGFMPDAPAEIRELYRRHARGNSLFRNRGDGTFEDVTLKARAEMGRWAWSSDALDFDSDGWDDLYVVNGMFTRAPGVPDVNLDSFFWRQVAARSPLTYVKGTAFDDAWRGTSRLLQANGSQASHERNVLLRNDGKGGFDEVSGAAGLDLDQDGRSFAVLDYDQDGDPDLVLMAPRSSPQLRVFRNDFAGRGATVALRLSGTKSNRDAVGARVTVETDTLRRTKVVQAGSGFISQHSKELVFGLGGSARIVKATIEWPSGLVQVLPELPINRRVRVEEGNASVRAEAFRAASAPGAAPVQSKAALPADPVAATPWLFRPFPAPDFNLRDLDGHEQSLISSRGRPMLLLFWSTAAPASRQALADLARQRQALTAAGASLLAIAVDAPADEPKVRAAAQGLGVPVAMGGDEVAGIYSTVSRFLYDLREDLRLPTLMLLSARGDVVKVYRDRMSAGDVLADIPGIEAPEAERLARALPFRGVFHFPPGERNDFQYSLDLAEQGFEGAALAAFQRAARRDPSAITLYNLGTLYMKNGQPAGAKDAFLRALDAQPGYPEASNSLGALLAQNGDLEGAVARFRAALAGRPDYADAMNNLGYALFQAGQEKDAFDLYQKALQVQPDFPEALNNLGIYFGQQGDLEKAESWFRKAVDARKGYGEAANNLALVLAARGDSPGAIAVLDRLLRENPAFEMGYVALAKVYAGAGRTRDAVQTLERLLQRNPTHPLALDILRQLRAGS